MCLAILMLTVNAGIPHGVSEAITTFGDGFLYFRTIGMEAEEPEYPRDCATGIHICTDGCEPEGTDRDIELWNATMLKLWEAINKQETRFTVTAGNEALYYEDFLLFFADQDGRTGILIYPEELWTILHHAEVCSTPALGQIIVEAYYPGMIASANVFVTANDPAMSIIQTLLDRGRDSREM